MNSLPVMFPNRIADADFPAGPRKTGRVATNPTSPELALRLLRVDRAALFSTGDRVPVAV